ncbi:DUF6879 family protein [Kribbella sp. NPDC058245]|uniref:DUF6879 family protein n=1 Tax=Kribbella sp. NPDC058245 TaxID=3346399 RepID=UPI0036EA3DE4
MARFDELFDEFRGEAFRLETLPGYAVGQDAERLADYAAGAYVLGSPIPGVEFVKGLVESGRRTTLVRLVERPLTIDQRLSIDWVYPHHAVAGREIAILEPGSELAGNASVTGDFWLFDDTAVALMRYAPDGRFDRADVVEEPATVARYVALRNQLWASAVPFGKWLGNWRRAVR